MILLWGLAGDGPMSTVRNELTRKQRTAVLLDQRAVLDTTVELSVDDEVSCTVEWDGMRLDLGKVKAAYIRPYDPLGVPAVANAGPASAEARHAVAVYEALRLWSEMTQALVVNRLSAMASNSSKPYQLELIRAAGFAVPETLITTDPEVASEFCDRLGGVVYKSVSGIRSVVSRVTPQKKAQLDAVTTCPTQFQEYVPGTDYRVHIVGDDAFVCELVSEADDYRYSDRQGARVSRRQVDLPLEWLDRCRALAMSLDLAVAGIDLRRTPAGDMFCFEVNPSPAFSWFDAPDCRIAKRIAELLAGAQGPRAAAARAAVTLVAGSLPNRPASTEQMHDVA
jgi:glutathione synthase/RimK-type ligase-like ATP-grasp enzyme